MKEAIGGTWLFGIVIFFVVLFATIISVSLNWSRAFKIKDEMINEIEKFHGFTGEAKANIDAYIGDIGYKSTGDCSNIQNSTATSFQGFRTGSDINNKYKGMSGDNYCVASHDLVTRKVSTHQVFGETVEYCGAYDESGKLFSDSASTGHPSSAYYTVAVFFKLDMPIIGSVFGFEITGETATIYNISGDDHFHLNSSGYC